MQQPPILSLPTMRVAVPMPTISVPGPTVRLPGAVPLPVIKPLGQPVAAPTIPLPIPLPGQPVAAPAIPLPGQPPIAVAAPTIPLPGQLPIAVAAPAIPLPAPAIPLPGQPPLTVAKPLVALPTQQPTVPMPGTPGVNVPLPTGGGILRQLGGAGITVVPTGVVTPVMAGPPKAMVEETPYSLLSQLMPSWNGTLPQVQTLIGLHYANGAPIIDLRRFDVINEIVGMLRTQPFDSVIQFLSSPECTGPDYVVWSQKSMDEGRIKVARELTIQRAEEVGVKGVGKCRHCASTELVFALRQTRSSDEPTSIFVRCVMCHKQWRQ